MSRITGFVNQTALNAIITAQSALTKQRDELRVWIARYEADPQCDDEDREAIAVAKKRAATLQRLALTIWLTEP